MLREVKKKHHQSITYQESVVIELIKQNKIRKPIVNNLDLLYDIVKTSIRYQYSVGMPGICFVFRYVWLIYQVYTSARVYGKAILTATNAHYSSNSWLESVCASRRILHTSC